MSGSVDGKHASRLVEAARRELDARGVASRDLRLVAEPVVTARSRLYMLGDEASEPLYVLKEPLFGRLAIDTDLPLTAEAQYEALKLACAWQQDDEAFGVSRPVAFLEDFGAFVMEYVKGRSLTRVIRVGLLRPAAAVGALAAAGDCLRRVHRHAARPDEPLPLSTAVEEVFTVESTVLRPLGIRLPTEVVKALARVPKVSVASRRVLTHGDFVPSNLIVTGRDQVAMIDPVLADVGLPEDDLARFLSVMGSETVFVSGSVVPWVARRRRSLEAVFCRAYGPSGADPRVLELRLLRNHALRWVRRRGHSRLPQDSASMRARQRLVDAHMSGLLLECGARIVQSS